MICFPFFKGFLSQIIFSLVDSGIDDQVVIDSTSAPNYASWQSNVNNEVIIISYCFLVFDYFL